MVRAGEKSFLFDDFKDLNRVSIGWEIGDLSGKSIDEVKQIMADKYSDYNALSLGNNTGQVTRFVFDFSIGDYVITYNPDERIYLVGKIASDYYYDKKLAEKHGLSDAYCHCRNVEWLGTVKRDDLSSGSANSLGSVITVFNVKDSVKNNILFNLNNGVIEWTDFYMEFADKLLEYKDDRLVLFSKIQNVFSDLNLNLPQLDADEEGNFLIPNDIDPFTVFALFNKQISIDTRINIVNEIKKEFSLKSKAPYTFHGASTVGNLKATFYSFKYHRGEDDIDNIWNLFEIALDLHDDNKDDFIAAYNRVLSQHGIKWNVTMALNWIRPFTFINLDSNNRELLSSCEIFQDEFKQEMNALKKPPSAEKYLHICSECSQALNNTDRYNNFPELSHIAYISKLNKNDKTSDEGIGDGDVKTVKYWTYSPGSEMWDKFYNDRVMAVGFINIGDLKQYHQKDDIKYKFQEFYNDKSSHKNDVHALWQFANDIETGDVIFAKKGMNDVIGIGIVESDYTFNEEYDPYFHHTRKVKWIKKGNWSYNGKLPTKTLTDITMYTELVNNIKELVGDIENIDEAPEDSYPKYSSEKFLNEVYVSQKDYNTLVSLLKHKKNLIIEGAPGVGKTFMAKRLAYSILGEKNINHVMMVQFHQSYSYEDFVMGYKPSDKGFELKEGSFYQFCKKAEEDSENDYFFIIDEINRGNLSKIFGELFMLIENDKRGSTNKIQLLYSDELFFIPKNIHIIGLMNTADRSLAMIDYALRRRFAFFDLKPGFNSQGFINYQKTLNDERFDNLILTIKQLNEEIKNDESLGEGFRIGHSYLANLKNCKNLDFIIEYEIIPLLKEYWFDEPDKVKNWSDKLRRVIN